jgi:hypothetical protein
LDVVDAVYLCYAVDKDLQMLTKPEIHDVMDEVVKKQTKNAGGFNTNNNAFIANPFAANNINSNNNNSNSNEMSAMAGAPQQQQQQQQQQQVVIGYPQQRSGQDQRPTGASHEDIDAV